MDRFSLIRWLLWVAACVLVTFLSSPSGAWAYGSVPATGTSTVRSYRCGIDSYPSATTSDSVSGACSIFLTLLPTQGSGYSCNGSVVHNTFTYSLVGCSADSCTYNNHTTPGCAEAGSPSDGEGTLYVQETDVDTPTCAGGTTAVAGACICDVGTKAGADGTCVPYTCPGEGSSVGGEGSVYDVSGPGDTCFNGCQAHASMSGQQPGGGSWNSWGPFNSTGGGACNPSSQGGSLPGTGATAAGGNTPSTPCGVGQCPGTVNGTSVCVACSSVATKSTKTTTSSSGSTTTTTTSTQCTDGTCTSTTSSSDGSTTVTTGVAPGSKAGKAIDGGGDAATGTGNGDGTDMSTFCADNPTSPICKTSSWGGSCGGFSCDGDAVQCAMAREQHDRNCTLFDTPTDLSSAGVAAVAAGNQPTGHPYLTPGVTDLSGGFDQTNLVSAGCPGDLTVHVGGASVSIPFSRLCAPAAMLGNVLVGITALVCLGIVFKGN